MRHLAIFSMFLALPLGIIAIVKLFQFYSRYRYRYLKIFGYILIFTSLQLGFNLINNYILTNIFPRFVPGPGVTIEVFFRFLVTGTHLIWFFLIFVFSREIFNQKVSFRVKRFMAVLGILMTLMMIVLTLRSLMRNNVLSVLLGYILILFLIYACIMAIGVQFLLNSYKEQNKQKRFVLSCFGWIFFSPMWVILFLALFHLSNKLDNDYLILISSLHLIVLFSTTIKYLKKFMVSYHHVMDASPSKTDRFEGLFAQYKLSKREQEVIELISAGKTNQEIADHLYLSLLTVKSYVFKIYRKAGVKNRVQLTNIFRENH